MITKTEMKGYYLYDSTNIISEGVRKKIHSQCELFSEEIGKCVEIPLKKRKNILMKLCRRIPLCPDGIDWKSIYRNLDADYIYIRKIPVTLSFLIFLKKVKKKCSSTVIVIEIPTYPYDEEMKREEGILFRPILYRDMLGRQLLYKYVDYVSVMGRVGKKLWRIPAIKTFNGVDLDVFSERNPIEHNGVIRLVCVANFARYHGIDKLLYGLEEYYGNGGDRLVEVYLAGAGVVSSLIDIVDKTKYIKNKVFFKGVLNVMQVKKLYDECDIGVVSLGYSRIGLSYNTTIKSKEYLAVGIPFIGDTEIDVLNGKDYNFYRQITDYDKTVDFHEIIQFYDEIFQGGKMQSMVNIAHEMRQYAELHVSRKKAMQDVCDSVKIEYERRRK